MLLGANPTVKAPWITPLRLMLRPWSSLWVAADTKFVLARLQCALLHESPEAAPSGFQSFMCGLAAGTLAKLGSHPLDVAKKRYQVRGHGLTVACEGRGTRIHMGSDGPSSQGAARWAYGQSKEAYG